VVSAIALHKSEYIKEAGWEEQEQKPQASIVTILQPLSGPAYLH